MCAESTNTPTTEASTNQPIKKKVGRPRKTPLHAPEPRNGIATDAINPEHYVEFYYDNPTIFKKLWNYYKAMAIEKIHISFRSADVIIWGNDHHQKSSMRTCIKASKINHYYCCNNLDIGLICSDLEKVMNAIDRSCTSICIIARRDQLKRYINIIITTELKIERYYTIELIGNYDKLVDEQAFLISDEYPVHFELPSKYFKKMITDIRLFSDQITIRHDNPGGPLIFDYTATDKKIKSEDTVKDGDSISFHSSIQEGEMFRTSFKIDYIRPISAALLGEYIHIFAHESKPLLCLINIDDYTVDIRVLTDIINDRTRL